MHLGYYVDSVDQHPLVLGRSQRNVERGPLLGHVDLFAVEHGINAPGQAAFLGQPEQQTEGCVADAMLRVVEIEPGGFGGQTLAPARIVGEELAQMPMADLLVVVSQGFPRRPRSQGW